MGELGGALSLDAANCELRRNPSGHQGAMLLEPIGIGPVQLDRAPPRVVLPLNFLVEIRGIHFQHDAHGVKPVGEALVLHLPAGNRSRARQLKPTRLAYGVRRFGTSPPLEQPCEPSGSRGAARGASSLAASLPQLGASSSLAGAQEQLGGALLT